MTFSPVGEVTGAAQSTFPGDTFSFDKVFDTDENANLTRASGEVDAPLPASSANGVAEPTESTAATPKVQPVALGVFSPQSEGFLSPAPDNESFVTAPSSAALRSRAASPDPPFAAAPQSYSLSTQELRGTDETGSNQPTEASAAHFPPIEEFVPLFSESPIPGAPLLDRENVEQTSQEQSIETDLSTELKDLDGDESDSDSDDEVPLSEIAKNKLASQDVVPADKRVQPPTTTFDDIFGVASPPATDQTPPQIDAASQPQAEPHNVANTFDAFNESTSPFEPSLTGTSTTIPSAAADNTGISAFDEALKSMPTRNGVGASNLVSDGQPFTAGATFGDFFDFSSPNTSAPAPASPVSFPLTTNANGSTAPTHTDDGFNNLSSAPKLPTIAPDGTKSLSFEAVFAGFESSPSADVSTLANQATTQTFSAPAKSEPTTKSFPSFTPTSPEGGSSPRGSAGYPETSLRSSSPAPQKTKASNATKGPSPKSPRPSTSSSTGEKPAAMPTRPSKLSVSYSNHFA